jgi:hypothetical protein
MSEEDFSKILDGNAIEACATFASLSFMIPLPPNLKLPLAVASCGVGAIVNTAYKAFTKDGMPEAVEINNNNNDFAPLTPSQSPQTNQNQNKKCPDYGR